MYFVHCELLDSLDSVLDIPFKLLMPDVAELADTLLAYRIHNVNL